MGIFHGYRHMEGISRRLGLGREIFHVRILFQEALVLLVKSGLGWSKVTIPGKIRVLQKIGPSNFKFTQSER